jgi:hypothetical protein
MEYKKAVDAKFTVSDPSSQYLGKQVLHLCYMLSSIMLIGYIDFALHDDYLSNRNIVGFRYAENYSKAQLFRFDQDLLDKCNLKAL